MGETLHVAIDYAAFLEMSRGADYIVDIGARFSHSLGNHLTLLCNWQAAGILSVLPVDREDETADLASGSIH